MKQSHLFTKTRREAPKDEVSKNAQLLIRAGFIHKEMAGIYSFLPLGLRTMNKIVGIIREEMNAIGGQELSLTALQDKHIWEKSGRWSDEVLDVWFKTTLKNGTELGLGTTHEEQLTNLQIRTHRGLRSFRSCVNATGVAQIIPDLGRIHLEECRRLNRVLHAKSSSLPRRNLPGV